MERNQFYQAIGLPEETIKKLDAIAPSIHTADAKLDGYLGQMLDIHTAPQAYQKLKTLLGDDPDHLKMLYCQLECARRCHGAYRKKQIPDAYYLETMKCFPRFLAESKQKNGRACFDRGWWTYRQTSMVLFRIGALEYESCNVQGEDVLALHIPSDADLSKKAVDASLMQAETFFKTYYGDMLYRRYTCHSWLLSPVLKTVLSGQSNILGFQQRFTVVREDKDDREFIEWLFQVPAGTAFHALPANTSLQKKVKQLLLAGGTVGAAYGVMEKASLQGQKGGDCDG